MHPGPIFLFGIAMVPWNVAFLVGVAVGYFVLRSSMQNWNADEVPRLFPLRYLAIVYICAIAAQLLSYAADAGTSFYPPEGWSFARYYLHPLAGPKTLYGAIIALPAAISLAFGPFTKRGFWRTVDVSTPALMTILAFARVGCFLQGCCYGLRTDIFGLTFPVGSSVHADQFLQGLIHNDQSALPVLPTQLASALACLVLAWTSGVAVRRRQKGIFFHSIFAYSVFRFAIEFVRADTARNYAGLLSTSQWIALVVIASFLIARSPCTQLRPRYRSR